MQRPSTNGFNALNRPASSLQDIHGFAAQTLVQYNALDNATRVTDPKGLNTIYTYNGFGDLLGLTSPDTGAGTMTVDVAGNMASRTDDAAGNTTQMNGLRAEVAAVAQRTW